VHQEHQSMFGADRHTGSFASDMSVQGHSRGGGMPEMSRTKQSQAELKGAMMASPDGSTTTMTRQAGTLTLPRSLGSRRH
jgi:hypothetical protein